MPSVWEDDYFGDAAWDVWNSAHAEEAVVTPAGSGATTIMAVFNRGQVLDGFDGGESDDRGRRAFGVLIVKPDAVANWTPARGDQVVIGSVTYQVVEVGEMEPAIRLQLFAVSG